MVDKKKKGTGSEENKILYCSFCGKGQNEVRKLIAGPSVYICDECVDLCNNIIEEELSSDEENQELVLYKPKEIKSMLDDYVIDQDVAKKVLSVAVYNHYKRLIDKPKPRDEDYVEIGKSNILLIGPTGSGKTLLAQTLARILNVPFAIADATTLTEAGYVGEDVENIVQKLLQNCDYDVERAERGIIYIDEIDKICNTGDYRGADASAEGVQRDLLPLIEGSTISTKYGNINTDYILFIASGAFHAVKPSDMLPELQGRLPIRVELNGLTEDDLYKILTEPVANLLRQQTELLATEGVTLKFEDDAVQEIARMAALLNRTVENIGARRLHTVIERIMESISFEAAEMEEGSEIVVDKSLVNERLSEVMVSSDLSRYIL